MTKVTIWFDMDGTITDLYAVNGWLEMLRAYDATPYMMAKPMVNMSALARQLNSLQRKGFSIGIISWCSKCSTQEYDEAVTMAKRAWLAQHLPSVNWDAIEVVPYGTPKHEVCDMGNVGILFDDEQRNRDNWNIGTAFEPCDISKVLSLLGKAAK